MKLNFQKNQIVTYAWQGKSIKCKVVDSVSEPGQSLSLDDGTTYHVHEKDDSTKYSGEPLYKLSIIEESSNSKGQEVLHYESELAHE